MRIFDKPTTAEKIAVGQVIHNPNFPGLNRCLEVNEIDDSRPGRRILTDTYLDESATVYFGQALTLVVTEY